jgi:DNA-directed RNA polymerase specialized sigma24 family protein
MTSAVPSSVNRPFDSLVRDIRPQLVRFLSKIVGETEAKDVTQAALAKTAVAPTNRNIAWTTVNQFMLV